MGCCFSGTTPQLQLAASIDFDYDDDDNNNNNNNNKFVEKPMSDWHRGQVLHWLDNNKNKELRKLKHKFHQHQISGLTLATITKIELVNELNINEDALCDLFLNQRDEFMKIQTSSSSSGPSINNIIKTREILRRNSLSRSRSISKSNIDVEIKYDIKIHETRMSITDLYNVLQQFNMNTIKMKIIDLRDSRLFCSKHILTSININYTETYNNHKTENNEILDFKDLSIIDTNYIHFLDHLQSFKSETSLIVVFNKDNDQNKMFKTNIENYLLRIYKINQFILLDDDFVHFYEKYPFLCFTENVDTKKEEKKEEKIENRYPTEVIENKLFIGDWKQSQSFIMLNELKITHILNVSNKKQQYTKINTQYKHIEMEDNQNQNILNNGYLNDAIKWIDHCLQSDNDRILIHCLEGISCSATIVIGYLMYKNKWNFIAAQQYLKNIRPNICPNDSFCHQLQQFQTQININC